MVKIVLWIFGKIMIRAELPLLFLWRYTWKSEQDRESGLIFILIYKKERRNSEHIFNGNIYYSATGYSWIYRVDFEKPKGTQRC